MELSRREQAKRAILLGATGSFAYWVSYLARNVLSVVSPEIIESGSVSVEFIGLMSTVHMFSYAVGQLVNGVIGDRVKAKYLVSGGLVLSGGAIAVLGWIDSNAWTVIAYGLMGFFLSMLYAPLVRAFAENTNPVHAARCCLGLSFASVLGAPAAGIVALIFHWRIAFWVSGGLLFLAGIGFFLLMAVFEKKGIVHYGGGSEEKEEKKGLKALWEHEIVKYVLISFLTGIVRTSVLFWIPTYLTQHLGFSPEAAATAFTVMTVAMAASPYLSNLLLYERVFKRNRNRTLLFTFSASALSFLLMFVIRDPIVNIIFAVLALVMNSGAAEMLFSVYCPSLRETGMVSTATGFLDFVHYLAAAAANLIFANAIAAIGWGNLILTWAGLMAAGVLVSVPWKGKRVFKRGESKC